jgi:hypothetical protein
MKDVQEWAEEHWAGVALVVSVTGAISLAAALIVLFNVLTMR